MNENLTPTTACCCRRVSRTLVVFALLGALLLGAGGWHAYDVHVRYRLGTVTEGQLYRSGAMPPAHMAEVAKKLGLRAVIDLRTFVPGQDSTNTTPLQNIEAEGAALATVGVRHIRLPSAQVPDPATLEQFLRVMADPANRPALVHCYHGVGRTELFAAVYRIEFEGWTPEKARAATRLLLAGSSFSDHAEKGRFLKDYLPRRGKTGPTTGVPEPSGP
jgi:protein tyrosine/serine phosphatase